MPVEIKERFDSRAATAGTDPATELLYQVRGTDDDAAVLELVESTWHP